MAILHRARDAAPRDRLPATRAWDENAHTSRTQPAADRLATSPRMAAQRKSLTTLFGQAVPSTTTHASTASGTLRSTERTMVPPSAGVVQRDVEPGQEDPLTDMMTNGSKSLLYGASGTRKHTSLRATAADPTQWGKERRTIDAYNDDIGLSDHMGAADPSNIFKVREALAAGDVVGSWGGIITPRLGGYAADADLAAWLQAMKAKASWIGLEDLGGGAATPKLAKAKLKRFKSKKRYQKNFNSKARYKARQALLTPDFIHQWLAANRTHADAELDKTTVPISSAECSELARWISKAFWRRTSKLGIDFTLGRGHRIHMNTAADPKFNFDKPKTMKLKPGKLKKMKETYGRMITTSEYRHIKKGLKNGTITPGQVNLYDEVSH